MFQFDVALDATFGFAQNARLCVYVRESVSDCLTACVSACVLYVFCNPHKSAGKFELNEFKS